MNPASTTLDSNRRCSNLSKIWEACLLERAMSPDERFDWALRASGSSSNAEEWGRLG
jgi:hypothetical protein